MKKLALILSPFILVIFYLVFNLSLNDKSNNNETKILQTLVGKEDSKTQIYLIADLSQHSYKLDRRIKEVNNFLTGLKFSVSDLLSSDKVSLKIGSEEELFNKLDLDNNIKVVTVPEDFILSEKTLKKLEEKNIPLILFTTNQKNLCFKNTWNFGASSDQFDEVYLSYLSQKFTKLGSDLDLILYSNEVTEPRVETNNYSTLIPELGMKVLRVIIVDDRANDLYSTLRGILQINGKLLLGIFSDKGLDTFLPQAHKLGLSFEIGVSLGSVHSDEQLEEFSQMTEELIYPTFYSKDIKSLENEKFSNQFTKDVIPSTELTTNTYRGYLLGEVLNRILTRIDINNEPVKFLNVLSEMDGLRILTPSGSVMISSAFRGLIQPIYVAKKHKDKPTEVLFLGDISPTPNLKCE